MKTIVLHGDDTQKSYSRLTTFINEAKKRGWKVTDFDMSDIENQSLFGEESFYILKDYKELDKKIVEKLKKYTGNLVVYHSAKIPAPTLKLLNADKVEVFELPQLLWKFLDNMTVKGLHELVQTQPVEFVMAMIAWKLKQKYTKSPNEKTTRMINELAELDVKSKTGKANLLQSLTLLLAREVYP